MSDSYAVAARGLVKRYGSTIALDGIDLEIPTGTVTAVLVGGDHVHVIAK